MVGLCMHANEVVIKMFSGELKLHNAFMFASHTQLNTEPLLPILTVLMFE